MTKGKSSDDDQHVITDIIVGLYLTLPEEGQAEFIRYLEGTYPLWLELYPRQHADPNLTASESVQ